MTKKFLGLLTRVRSMLRKRSRKESGYSFFLTEAEMLDKFEAVFKGALIGVCIGKKFEGIWGPNLYEITEEYLIFKKLASSSLVINEDLTLINPFTRMTDSYNGDVAISLALAESIIYCNDLFLPNTAYFFQERFLRNPDLGFATSNITICKRFNKLLTTGKLDDNFMLPASELFDGEGTFGSSAAARSFPIALFTYNKSLNEMQLACELQTRLTHTHFWAIIGSLQQCYAIREALNSNILAYRFDFDLYLIRIINFVFNIENEFNNLNEFHYNNLNTYSENMQKNFELYMKQRETILSPEVSQTNHYYSKLLKQLYRVLRKRRKGHKVNIRDVYEKMGKKMVVPIHTITVALISSIVACDETLQHELNETLLCDDAHEMYSPIERVIFYATKFSGETVTICSLAGAIVGAFYGKRAVPNYLFKMCEDHDEIKNMANELHKTTKTY